MNNYVVFVRERKENARIWVEKVAAYNADEAEKIGLHKCLDDWGIKEKKGFEVIVIEAPVSYTEFLEA